MSTFQAIIIDDEQPAIDLLQGILEGFPEIELADTFNSARGALKYLIENSNVELIFLDIEMPGMNGFEFLKELQQYPFSPCIIFTTGYEKHAVEAIRNAAFDFLIKPVQMDELEAALQRLQLCRINQQFKEKTQVLFKSLEAPKKIIFPHHRGFIAYNPSEILYIQASRNYSEVHLVSGKTQTVSMQLGQIEEAIPSTHFFRISRSVIINLQYLSHADQKERKCYLEVNRQNYEFDMKVAKMKELMRVMMGE